MSQTATLAAYILDWLRRRNGGELDAAIGAMRLHDFDLAKKELELILIHNGKPPNWKR